MGRKVVLLVMSSVACSTQVTVTEHKHYDILQNARSFKGEIDSHKLNVHSERIDQVEKQQSGLRREIDALKVNLGSSRSDEYDDDED